MFIRVLALFAGLLMVSTPMVSKDSGFFVLTGLTCSFYGCVGQQGWRQMFHPLSKYGYISVCILFTIGFLILYNWTPEKNGHLAYFLMASGILLTLKRNTGPVKLIHIVMFFIFFMLLGSLNFELPRGMFRELLGTWSFTGTLWIMSLSILTAIFVDAQMKKRPDDFSV